MFCPPWTGWALPPVRWTESGRRQGERRQLRSPECPEREVRGGSTLTVVCSYLDVTVDVELVPALVDPLAALYLLNGRGSPARDLVVRVVPQHDHAVPLHAGVGGQLGLLGDGGAGVGDLKKVLSNVKTKGVFGEYQLGNILEQILTPDQYGNNVATNPDYNGSVEYAVKMPGKDTDSVLWLPIDSKFPTESYEALLDAYEVADKDTVEAARKTLIRAIDGFAKDISTKYISVPNTTDFAIMFLPIEGLFAEVLREPGIMETLRSKHKIALTGPTTLSALLNSLQMGFRTLLVQERSSEVWNILAGVKSEFSKFEGHLSKVQSQLKTASTSLDSVQGTRTRAIDRKLRDVEVLDSKDSDKILDLPKSNNIDIDEDLS